MTVQVPLATNVASKKPKFKNNLARSLAVVLLFFAIIPISILGLSGYLRARYLLRQQTASQIHNTTQNQTYEFNQSIKARKIRLQRVGEHAVFLEVADKLISGYSTLDEEELIKEFELINRPRGIALFDDFFLLNPEGVIYAGSDNTWQGVSLNVPLLSEQIASQKDSIGIYNPNSIFSESFIIFTITPLSSNSGKELGVLVGITKNELVKDFLAKTTLFNPEATAYIISANDVYLGIDPYTEELTSFLPSQEQEREVLSFLDTPTPKENEPSYLLEFENNFGVDVIAQVHQLDSVNSKIILEIPEKVAFGHLGDFGPFSFFLFLSTLLILGTVLLYARKQVVKPIQKLSEI